MTGGANANRASGHGGNYGSKGGGGSSKGSSSNRGGGDSARYMTHKSGDRGRVTKVERTPSGDTVIEITKDDGTTHRDYNTYFSSD